VPDAKEAQKTNKMGLLSSPLPNSIGASPITTVRYVTAVALGLTALAALGVVRHADLTHRASTGLGLGPERASLGHSTATTPEGNVQHKMRQLHERQPKTQTPQLLEVPRPTPTAKATTAAVAAAATVAAPRLGPTTPFSTAFDGTPAVYRYEVVNKFPHDPAAFTQGLVFSASPPDTLFESTGCAQPCVYACILSPKHEFRNPIP
jgi:hypothetical protein